MLTIKIDSLEFENYRVEIFQEIGNRNSFVKFIFPSKVIGIEMRDILKITESWIKKNGNNEIFKRR